MKSIIIIIMGYQHENATFTYNTITIYNKTLQSLNIVNSPWPSPPG